MMAGVWEEDGRCGLNGVPPCPWTLAASAPLAAIAAALALAAGLILAAGVNPLTAYVEMLRGALGSRLAVTEMLTRAVPLMLTGLAAAVAFRARLWNIGGEGQFYVARWRWPGSGIR
jgi:ABC-type uncharacterized transport system permease subunit